MEITLRIPDQVYNEDPTYAEYFKILQAMIDRMAVSHFKYGRLDDNAKTGMVDEMLCARKRMWMYDGIGPQAEGKRGDTGNVENLYDAANFVIIEAMFPQHGAAHFKAQRSQDSPGLEYRE